MTAAMPKRACLHAHTTIMKLQDFPPPSLPSIACTKQTSHQGSTIDHSAISDDDTIIAMSDDPTPTGVSSQEDDFDWLRRETTALSISTISSMAPSQETKRQDIDTRTPHRPRIAIEPPPTVPCKTKAPVFGFGPEVHQREVADARGQDRVRRRSHSTCAEDGSPSPPPLSVSARGLTTQWPLSLPHTPKIRPLAPRQCRTKPYRHSLPVQSLRSAPAYKLPQRPHSLPNPITFQPTIKQHRPGSRMKAIRPSIRAQTPGPPPTLPPQAPPTMQTIVETPSTETLHTAAPASVIPTDTFSKGKCNAQGSRDKQQLHDTKTHIPLPFPIVTSPRSNIILAKGKGGKRTLAERNQTVLKDVRDLAQAYNIPQPHDAVSGDLRGCWIVLADVVQMLEGLHTEDGGVIERHSSAASVHGGGRRLEPMNPEEARKWLLIRFMPERKSSKQEEDLGSQKQESSMESSESTDRNAGALRNLFASEASVNFDEDEEVRNWPEEENVAFAQQVLQRMQQLEKDCLTAATRELEVNGRELGQLKLQVALLRRLLHEVGTTNKGNDCGVPSILGRERELIAALVRLRRVVVDLQHVNVLLSRAVG